MRLGPYAWLLFAVTLAHAESIQNLTAQIQKKPSAALYVDRGSAYLQAGDAKQAVADFDRALDQNAVNVEALRLRALAQAKLGRSSNVITDLSSAIGLAPGDASLYLARAEAYAAAGDALHASEDREEALRLDPAVSDAGMKAVPPTQAAVEARIGSAPAPGIAPLTVAANLAVHSRHEPKPTAVAEPTPTAKAGSGVSTPAPPSTDESPDALYLRGRDFINKGQPAEGIAALTEAIQQQPKNAAYYNSRGFGYYLTKDFKRAIQDFDEALSLKPDYLNAVHNRALAKKNAGDQDGYQKDRQLELQLSKKK